MFCCRGFLVFYWRWSRWYLTKILSPTHVCIQAHKYVLMYVDINIFKHISLGEMSFFQQLENTECTLDKTEQMCGTCITQTILISHQQSLQPLYLLFLFFLSTLFYIVLQITFYSNSESGMAFPVGFNISVDQNSWEMAPIWSCKSCREPVTVWGTADSSGRNCTGQTHY